MSSAHYSNQSLSWQIRQTLRRFSEWAEYQANQINLDPPDWSLPDWPWSVMGETLFWILVALLTLWLCWLMYRALEPSIRRWLEQDRDWASVGGSVAAVEETHSARYWWQQAQEQAQQGNYGAACKSLYQATLQQLNDSQTLLHDPSRTDGEYLTRLGQDRPLPRPYRLLIGTHERLVFGSAIASAEMFKRCRQAYEEIVKK